MNLRQYLTIMFIATIMCWIAFGFVIYNIDPYQDTGVGFSFFYISLFFSLLGTMSIIIFAVRKIFSRDLTPMYKFVHTSFRDSFFVALVLIGLLYLQAKGYLHWWNLGLVLIIMVLVIAFIFSSKKNSIDKSPFRS